MTKPETAASVLSLIVVVTMFSQSSVAQSLQIRDAKNYTLSHYYFEGAMDSTGWKTVVGKDTTVNFAPHNAVVVYTILQTWDAYLAWCADSVQKRGWDELVFDSTSFQRDSVVTLSGWRSSYFARTKPMYYFTKREPRPNIYGYIEWLRNKAKGVPQ